MLSFSNVAINLSSSPKRSIISAFDPIPNALNNTVTGCFLVLSTLTEITSLESVSYSNQAPLLGITVEDISAANVLFEQLMGTGVTARKEYIRLHSQEAVYNAE